MVSVTVVVPVHNAEKYLTECLDSLTHQTLIDIEIICINDGSTDASKLILDDYASKDHRIKVVEQECKGVSSARNAGIVLARGEYILFVDADDYIAHRTCEYLLSVAKEAASDIVVFGGKSFPSLVWADKSFPVHSITYSGDEVVHALLYEPGSRPFAWNKLYSTSLLRSSSLRFAEELSIGEDQLFQFEAFPEARRITFVEDQLYFYRIHSASAIGSIANEVDTRLEMHVSLAEKVVESWSSKGLTSLHATSIICWIVDFLYEDFFMSSYCLRQILSNRIAAIVPEVLNEALSQGLDARTARKLDRLVSAGALQTQVPLVTFVISSHYGETISLSSLQSILGQTEQRIECLIDASCIRESASTVIARDERCKLMQGSSISTSLDNAQGIWTVFCSGNAVFKHDAVERLLPVLLKSDDSVFNLPDILIYQESACVLSHLDPLDCIKPDPSSVEHLPERIAIKRFGEALFPAIGLSPANKFYNTAALKAATAQLSGEGGHCICSLAKLLKSMRNVCFVPDSLVSLMPIRFGEMESDCQRARSVLQSIFEEMDQIEAGLRSVGMSEYGFGVSIVDYCLALTKSLERYEDFECVSCLIRRQIAQCFDSGLVKNTNWACIYSAEETLLETDQCFFMRQHEIKQEAMAASNRELDDQANKYALWASDSDNRERQCREQLSSLYSSASYRLGSTITAPVRRLLKLLKSSQ